MSRCGRTFSVVAVCSKAKFTFLSSAPVFVDDNLRYTQGYRLLKSRTAQGWEAPSADVPVEGGKAKFA
jgi:hypothetical protein